MRAWKRQCLATGPVPSNVSILLFTSLLPHARGDYTVMWTIVVALRELGVGSRRWWRRRRGQGTATPLLFRGFSPSWSRRSFSSPLVVSWRQPAVTTIRTMTRRPPSVRSSTARIRFSGVVSRRTASTGSSSFSHFRGCNEVDQEYFETCYLHRLQTRMCARKKVRVGTVNYSKLMEGVHH